ncbi:zinc finger protein 862-like [Saccostrea echinata]|uniref:zinc finger protein 862-like n=1 Tax=Saccostrea echinata TaxID=191078 RepID=UPI002A82F424|nr:zinc finger protein 862-like [Saccostrea echinata]
MVIKGKVEVKFIGCKWVTKADAKGVFLAMKRAVEGVRLDWSLTHKKMVGLGSDGAAVMTGKKTGVAALLKEHHPSIISIHCLAHRLELAYKDALKGIKVAEKVVSGLLLGLYYFYHNSPLNRANLKESYKTLGIDMKMPTRVGGTRWVGHVLLALKNMFHGYASIKQHLYQLAFGSGVQAIAKCKALGLYKILVDDNNITFAAFLLDNLSLLHIMSQVFQREESCVADIHRALNSCLCSLNRFSDIFPDVHVLSWPEVQRQFNRYENIFGLIDLLLTLPSSSSECERGFSQMKKIKKETRTRLTEASFNDLMTVHLHSDAIDKFDPIPAINKWTTMAMTKRRPQFNDKKG